MVEPKQCEFLLIRYVPDAVRNEFVNIGIVLLDRASQFADVRFTRDWRRVRCLDPDADIEMLQALEEELQERLRAGGADRERILHLLNDSFANAVQVSASAGVLTESPQQELARLAELYVDLRAHPRRREPAGRAALRGKMRNAFIQAGVWDLMFHDVPVAEYTHKGDPLRLDCGYRSNGLVKFFHAVSLTSDSDAAKALAFSYPQIGEGMARVKQVETSLTAIVEEHLPREQEGIEFAIETLRRSSIPIATTADLPQLAETARRELRV